jgi:hypothetical protein
LPSAALPRKLSLGCHAGVKKLYIERSRLTTNVLKPPAFDQRWRPIKGPVKMVVAASNKEIKNNQR